MSANWFHCSMKVIGRSAGRSVVAAAYRCGQKLHDELTQQTHDYTRREGVENTFIVAPAHAPEWAQDWGKLWNHAEACENRSNSQVAREWEIALPASVSMRERENIARQFSAHLVERYGVAVAVALHKPSKQGDQRNYHAHILMTTRRMGEQGLGEKTRELVNRTTGAKEIAHLREYAAALINESLAGSGSNERVDYRSHKERGIEQLPTQHLGVEASAMERKKKRSRIGDFNRDVGGRNQRITTLRKELAALDVEIAGEEKTASPQTVREQHYQQAREQQKVIRRPEIAQAVGRICANAGYEALRKRLLSPPIEPPPPKPLDPTPGGSYREKLKQERETQGNDITR